MTTAHLLSERSADLISAFDRERQRRALRPLAALLELDPERQAELFCLVENEISNQVAEDVPGVGCPQYAVLDPELGLLAGRGRPSGAGPFSKNYRRNPEGMSPALKTYELH